MTNLSQLRWRCRRGMKELDIVLLGYLERHYQGAPSAQQAAFVQLLAMEDPELFPLLMTNNPHPDEATAHVIRSIRRLKA